MDPFVILPNEIIDNIIDYLFVDWESVSSCRVVNKYWHQYVTQWATLSLEREFGVDPQDKEDRKKEYLHTLYFLNGLSYLNKINRPLAISINIRGATTFGLRRFETDLTTFTNLIALRVNSCKNFPSLRHLTKLEYMEIINPGMICHVESFPRNIRTMICTGPYYNDSIHHALLKLTRLESLEFAYSTVRANLMHQICRTIGTNLKSLVLLETHHAMKIDIFNELTRLTNLERLSVERTFYEDGSDHFQIFGSLIKLTSLYIGSCSHANKQDSPNYHYLSTLTRLKQLNAFPSHYNITEFLRSITALTNIELLNIDCSNLYDDDMRPLLCFSKLKTLSLFYSKNFSSKLSNIFNQVPALRRLDIYSWQVPNDEVTLEDLSPSITVEKCSKSFAADYSN